MKRITSIILLSALFAPASFGWGRVGHATVAQIAEDHLKPKVRRTLDAYLGKSITEIASDADKYRSVWTLDLGFVPSNPDDARVKWLKGFDFSSPLNVSPWSHSITVDENFHSYATDNLDGAYINNDAYYVDMLAARLKKNAKNMTKEEVYRSVALIVHFLGDMHCPMHIVYLPSSVPVKGAVKVNYKDKPTTLHKIWDGAIFSGYPKDCKEMAKLADTATRKEIRQTTRGNVYEWAGYVSYYCWPLHNEFKDGDFLPDNYASEREDYLLTELRNGGYRLAAVLNWIFK